MGPRPSNARAGGHITTGHPAARGTHSTRPPTHHTAGQTAMSMHVCRAAGAALAAFLKACRRGSWLRFFNVSPSYYLLTPVID